MSFTRFYDDESRIRKQLAESTFLGRYMLDAPGPGKTPFAEDCYLRLQRFGANVRSNGADIESDMRGLTRKCNRDHLEFNNHTSAAVRSSAVNYMNAKPFVEESRYSHPAWEPLEYDNVRTHSVKPFGNLQARTERPFGHSAPSRMEEKDNYDAGIKRAMPEMKKSCMVYDNRACQFINA